MPHAARAGGSSTWKPYGGRRPRPVRSGRGRRSSRAVAARSARAFLGREGPIVQRGAAIGAAAGRRGRLDVQGAEGSEGARMLHTALRGAGLAVAFSAPLGGPLFLRSGMTAGALMAFDPSSRAVVTSRASACWLAEA
ncbi:chloride channel protein [Streptomyces sp. NPDC056402]|uniref:chloride channel protein n=1 Tax=Streptomyces sp. NPDC056402 TaxID=3345810 RepID=UPI0035DAC1C6